MIALLLAGLVGLVLLVCLVLALALLAGVLKGTYDRFRAVAPDEQPAPPAGHEQVVRVVERSFDEARRATNGHH